jgi:Flp pilus assembly pilin Flp
MRFVEFVSQLHREESGQDLLEYALVLAAVLAAVVAGSSSIASTINSALDKIALKVNNSIS